MSFFSELKRRNVIRVALFYIVSAWLLLQIADLIFELLLVPDWTLRFIFGALLAAFPFVLFLAWAYELTPEGIKREADVDRSTSITARTGKRLNAITLVVVVGAIGAFLLDRLVFDEALPATEAPTAERTAAEPSETVAPSLPASGIAVLPFADLSPDADQTYFSHGIAEELLNVLTRIPELQVASRTSSFQFAGRDLALPEIAAALKVRYVLEGSVRKAGETLRITAQLIDSINDRHLWSDTYDRPLTAENVFAIQDEITQAIVGALSSVLELADESVSVAPATENLDAYELFLQARPLFQGRERLDQVENLLTEAVQLDPDFAAAWSMRAALQTLMIEYGYADLSREALEARTEDFAARALAIDERSPTALAALAKLASDRSWHRDLREDYDEILARFDRALEIEPRDGSALNWRGLAFMAIGRVDRATTDFGNCARFEPYYAPCVVNLHFALAAADREDEAILSFRDSIDRGVTHVEEAYLPLLARMDEEVAFKLITNGSPALTGWRRHDDLWRAFRAPGVDHGALLADLRKHLDGTDASPTLQQILRGSLGDFEIRPNVVMIWDASTVQLRRSERFRDKLRSNGVLDHWQKHGFPPMCRPIGDDDFECN